MLEAARGSPAVLRAELKVGAGTLARYQLALVLAMECERIICIARQMTPDLIRLQHDAEGAGARFHVVPGARALAGLVTANDEVLAIADGLLALPQAALELLQGSAVVLVQPVEQGVAAGFERIDLNYASAGIIRIPGRLVERLNELPADCDVVSALTRIALQAGIAQRELPAEVRDGVRWRLVRDEDDAHGTEAGWIAIHLGDDAPATPGAVLARFGVRHFGPAMLHAGSGGNAVAVGASAMVLMALASGWFGLTATALICLGLAWMVRRAATMLFRAERESLALPVLRERREAVFVWLLDAATVTVLAWSAGAFPWLSFWQRAFAPLMLLCLVRLMARAIDRRAAAWIGDRLLLALILAIAAGAGVLSQAVPLLATILAFAGILWPVSRRD